jgi:hypothetical protein
MGASRPRRLGNGEWPIEVKLGVVGLIEVYGTSAAEAGRRYGPSERRIRSWKSEWEPWCSGWVAKEWKKIIKESPDRRVETVIDDLAGRLRSGDGVPAQLVAITESGVANLAAEVNVEARIAARRWGLPGEEVLAWATAQPYVDRGETGPAAEHLRLGAALMALISTAGCGEDPPEPLDAQAAHSMTPHEIEVFFDMVDRHEPGCQLWRGPRGPIPGSMKNGLLAYRVASALESGEPAAGPCPENVWCCNAQHLRREIS